MPASPSAARNRTSPSCGPSCVSPIRATPPGSTGPRATPRTAKRPLRDALQVMIGEPKVIALLGFGEAGSAIARGLAADGGWRSQSKPGDNAPRRLIAIDPALDKDARGAALGKEARRLEVAIADAYTEALRDADLVICAVQGEHALDAATAAAPLLKEG